MDTSQKKCLIFISRIIPKPGQNTPEKMHDILPFKGDEKWKTLEVDDGSAVSSYYVDEQLTDTIVRIYGYAYGYLAQKEFWDQFGKQKSSNGTPEKEEDSFWFFEKILKTAHQLNTKFKTGVKTLVLFIHWGGGEFERKNEIINQHYQIFKAHRPEKAAEFDLHFTTFSYINRTEQNISGKIYTEKEPDELLKKIDKGFHIDNGQLNRTAYTKFISFEEEQVLNNESFLEKDELNPKSIQFIFNGKEHESDAQDGDLPPTNGIDEEDANDIFSGD